MQDKIIEAIAAYLGSVMTYNNSLTRIQFERACVNGSAEFIKQEAESIYAAISPHLGTVELHEPSEYPTRVDGEDFSLEF